MRHRRVGLYGGSFNPVHHGHLAIARQSIELFGLDELLMIPAHVPPHKTVGEVAPALHRYAMLALATQTDEQLKLSTIELDAPERPFTIETVTRLKASDEYKDARLFFLMGADSWMEIETWREWKKLLQAVETVVITRPNYELETAHVADEIASRIIDLRGASNREVNSKLEQAASLSERGLSEQESGEREAAGTYSPKRIYFSDAVMMNIAASDVRRRLQSGETQTKKIDEFVPRAVADYIAKQKLYYSNGETNYEERRSCDAE